MAKAGRPRKNMLPDGDDINGINEFDEMEIDFMEPDTEPESIPIEELEMQAPVINPINHTLTKVKCYFEEWECRVENGRYSRIRLLRACVKITEDDAELLNRSVLEGKENIIGKLYLLPKKNNH